MEVEYKGNTTFPVQITFGDRLQKLTKQASFELEEKLAKINLRLRMFA